MAINRFVFWVLAIALQAISISSSAADLRLMWDADPTWPDGTTVEACVDGDCISGISVGWRPFTSPGPGNVFHASARAVAPDGRMSVWTYLDQTVPPRPTGFWATRSVANMTAPTFVAQYATAFNTSTTPKTAMNAVAINSGDVLVAVASAENNSFALSITENGAATATLQRSSTTNDYAEVYGWTYVAPAGETITLSFSKAGGTLEYFGGNVVRFSGSDGVGASNVATGATGSPSVSLTTTQANSAIVVICSDWNAVSGTQTFTNNFSGTPTALTDYPGDSARYGVAIAFFPDAGAAGSKTVGMSAPTGQKWSIIAIEVKGTASGGAIASIMNQYRQRRH